MRQIIHSFLRKNEMSLLKESRKRLGLKDSDLNKLREHKFKLLIEQAKNKSPYYAHILKNESINGLKDLKKIKVLTKKILQEEFNRITVPDEKQFFVLNSTSGSTGKSTFFGSDSRFLTMRNVDLIRGNEMNNKFEYLDKMVTFWGAERDISDKKDLRYYYNYYIKHSRLISTYHMTNKNIEDNIKLLNKFKPKLIVGYPSALNFMAEYYKKNPNKMKHKPEAIISAGEMLYDSHRENIENSFGSEVYNRYGCREVGHIGSECNQHNGMHYDADRLIVEVIDDEGNSCPSDSVGNIVITDLNNYVFPLIRYKTGDLGALSKEDSVCECGCTLPKISKIEGRTFDIITGINGNNVSGTFWTITLKNEVSGVENFQVYQKELNKLDIRLMVNEGFNENEKKQIVKLVRKKLGEKMEINVILVENFEYTQTGKFKWITSQLRNS